MAVNDPNVTRTTEVRETFSTAADPAPAATVYVRESDNTGWLIAGVVALVAIGATVFMLVRDPGPSDEAEVAAAIETGRVQADIANAQMNMNQAAMSAQDAANRSAATASMQANDAIARAESAARAANQSAAEANARPTTVIISPAPVEPVQ